MSITLPLIVYGDSKIFLACFTMISAAVHDLSFLNLFKIALLLAGMTVLWSAVIKRDFMSCVRWLGSYYILYYILFLPTISLQIIDRKNAESVQVVHHIPLGLGTLASLSSLLGDSLTQLTEKIFSLPEELTYRCSGLMKASQLVAATSSLKIFDVRFNRNLGHFVHQCVIYDWLLHRYTPQDVFQAPQPWNFISQSVSSSRAFFYDQSILTCSSGVTEFQKDWTEVLKAVAHFYGSLQFPEVSDEASVFLNYLSLSYQFFTGLSVDSENILQSLLLLNFLSKNDASVQNTEGSLSQRVADTLPVLKNISEALLYSSFILIFLLTVFPFGMQLVKNYGLLLLFLQSWTPLYALLNFFGSYYAQIHSLQWIQGSLNLYSFLNLQSFHRSWLSLVNCLSLLIPLIAFLFLKNALRYSVDLIHAFEKVTFSSSSSLLEAERKNGWKDCDRGFQWSCNSLSHDVDPSVPFLLQTTVPASAFSFSEAAKSVDDRSPVNSSSASSQTFYQWLSEQVGTNGKGHLGKRGAHAVMLDPILGPYYKNRYERSSAIGFY